MSIPTLLGVPYDAASSFRRGCAGAPRKIREALNSPAGNTWTETLINLGVPNVWRDAGDVTIPNTGDVLTAIEAAAANVLAVGGGPISLGGDHSITYPLVRAVRRHHPTLSILHIDAHSDLYDEFEGNRYSHACPFARIMEAGLADRLVQVGIRTMTGHTRDQAQRFGVDVIDMPAWYHGARPFVDGPVYISIDLDGIDPAFAPGVSHPEPGGITARDVIALVQSIPGPLVAADICECNPELDPSGITSHVAAKLVKELIARMLTA